MRRDGSLGFRREAISRRRQITRTRRSRLGRHGVFALALGLAVSAARAPGAWAQEDAVPAAAQVEEAARRFLAAVRDGDDEALAALTIAHHRQTAGEWRRDAARLREAYAGHPERLAAFLETLVDAHFAAVRLAAPPGADRPHLDVALARLEAGWRVGHIGRPSAEVTLRQGLDSYARRLLWRRAVAADKAGDVAAAMAAYKALADKAPDQRLLYARFLQKQGRLDEAVPVARGYCADNPDKVPGLETLTSLLTESGRFREAIEAREELLTKLSCGYPSCRNELFALWTRLGEEARARAHYRAMAESPEAALRKAVLAHLMLADIALREQNAGEARRHFLLAVEKLPAPDDHWPQSTASGIIGHLLHLGWLDDAVKAYRTRRVPERLMALGKQLEREGRGEEMLALYREYILTEAHDGPRYAGLGVFYGYGGMAASLIDRLLELGQGPDLAEQLRARIAEQPRVPHLRRNLGCLLFKMKRHAEALRELDHLVEVTDKPSVRLYQWIGDLCRDAQLAEQAIAYYQKALAAEATLEEVRGWSEYAEGSLPEAEAKAALKRPILESLGDLYRQNQQWAEAERCFRTLLDSKPPWDLARHQAALAAIWKAMGKENPILTEHKARVAKEPGNAALRRDLARALLAAGQTPEAIGQLEQAVRLAPEDPLLRVELARTLARAGQLRAALEAFEEALRVSIRAWPKRRPGVTVVDPGDVLRDLAGLCDELDEQDRLLSTYRAVLALKAPEPEWTPRAHHLRLALDHATSLLVKRGERAEALALWLGHHNQVRYSIRDAIRRIAPPADSLDPAIRRVREMVERDPRDFPARLTLGSLLATAGRRDETLEVYSALARDAGRERHVHEELAGEFERLGRYKEALAEHEAVLRLCTPGGSGYVGRLAMLAALNLRLGNKGAAAAQYREALQLAPTNAEYREGLSKATDGKEPAAEPHGP